MGALAIGRRARYEALVRVVVEPLRRYAMRRVDHADAEDVVSDALLVLWRRLDDVPTDDPLPWCYGVVRRCLANAERSRRRQRLLTDRLRFVHPQSSPTTGQPILDPTLHRAMGRLRPGDRELLRLWAWEDLAPREIAVVLGTTSNAVAIRLHRAKARLAKELGAGTQTGNGKSRDLAGQIPACDPEATR